MKIMQVQTPSGRMLDYQHDETKPLRWTPPQLARILELSDTQVYNLIKAGKIAAQQDKITGRWLVEEAERVRVFAEYAEGRKAVPVPAGPDEILADRLARLDDLMARVESFYAEMVQKFTEHDAARVRELEAADRRRAGDVTAAGR